MQQRSKKRKMVPNNRNPIQQWTITYPQCGEMSRKEFVEKFPPFEEVFCACEDHKDGGLHLHMGIKLIKGITFSKMKDWVDAKFPTASKRIQYEATRSIKHWKNYSSKEDPYLYHDSNKIEKARARVEKLKSKMREFFDSYEEQIKRGKRLNKEALAHEAQVNKGRHEAAVIEREAAIAKDMEARGWPWFPAGMDPEDHLSLNEI